MFINKWNQDKITLRNYKSAKHSYKANVIKKYLNTQEYLLFFYYDFIPVETQQQLNSILIEQNLKILKIKKNSLTNFLKENNLNFMHNLMINNVFIIFNRNNQALNIKNVLKLNLIKNIHFLGIWLERKFLRPSELKKIHLLSNKFIFKNTVKILNLKKTLLKKSLTLKKT